MKGIFGRWFGSKPDAAAITDAPAELSALQSAKQLAKAGAFKQAIALLQPLAQEDCRNADLWLVLGASYLLNGQLDSAIKALDRAYALDPDSVATQINLATALRERGDSDRARATIHGVLRSNADHADALTLLGLVELDVDDVAAAIGCFERALAANPSHVRARFNRATALLRAGRSEDAWPDYERRAAATYRPGRPINATSWHGEPRPDHSLFIYAEQGVGDEILFASCFAAAAARVRSCTVECSPKLERLFHRSFPQMNFIGREWHNELTPPPESAHADIALAAGSLMQWFRPTAETMAAGPAYLRADPQRVEFWRQRLEDTGPGPYIGLCWRGGTRQTRRHLRTVPVTALTSFFPARPNATFVNLLHNAPPEELATLALSGGPRFKHFPDAFDDLSETAALMTALDLTLTVPTTLVALAAALRRPVWVMAPQGVGWMYGATGENAPWLPGARVFRQGRSRQWNAVLETVIAELSHWQWPDPVESRDDE